MRLGLACRAFFRVLGDRQVARQVALLLEGKALGSDEEAAGEEASSPVAAPERVATPVKSPRSEALTLLATLQREARFVDLVSESLDDYSDAQVGAATRDVLRDCGTVLKRMFDLQPVAEVPEGEGVELASDYDTSRYRLVGNVSGEGPYHGDLAHAGWQATRCEVPTWSGNPQAALIVAAAEVEIR
jgi:hypothetical protein